MDRAQKLRLFRRAWRWLEDRGESDGWNGAECWRAVSAWIGSGLPGETSRDIRHWLLGWEAHDAWSVFNNQAERDQAERNAQEMLSEAKGQDDGV